MKEIFGIPYFTILNAILFQLLWFACVVGAGANGWHIAAILAVGAISLATTISPVRNADWIIALSALAVGLGIDTLWINLGILVYADYEYAPYWIGLLWLGMGLTINHSLSWFRDRHVLGPLIVGLFAPVTYLTGQRFGAVSVPDLIPMFAVSVSWVVIFYALTKISFLSMSGAKRNQI